MQEALVINNLSKEYKIRENPDKGVFKLFDRQSENITISALKDISLSINKNETIGIIGDNGAGKTTLLKILSGITKPSFGTVDIYGEIASFLEIGVGFSPEMTGKENILFTASLMGIKKSLVKNNLKEIIEFSGIKNRINTPVKFYSKGMKIKLAFSIITFIDVDIMLFDEFIFIGEDIKFRTRIIEKLESLYKRKTILYVSHYIEDIKKVCDRVIWLENGHLKAFGNTQEIVENYLSSKHE